jgi:hypothetical protein
MTPETEAQIRNIRKFGTYARSASGIAGGVLVFSFLWLVWNIVAGPISSGVKVGLGAYSVTGDHLSTIQVKAWVFVVVASIFGILFAVVLHLQRLFAHLAAGSIYTPANVRHLRRVGTLALAMAVLQLVLPMITIALVDGGVIDRTLVTLTEPSSSGIGILMLGPASLSGFVMAALVLLASWIMDVGRQTADDADTMRREADLVI